jgi:hypothetical protein
MTTVPARAAVSSEATAGRDSYSSVVTPPIVGAMSVMSLLERGLHSKQVGS